MAIKDLEPIEAEALAAVEEHVEPLVVDAEEMIAREAGLTLDELRELRASNARLWPLGQ